MKEIAGAEGAAVEEVDEPAEVEKGASDVGDGDVFAPTLCVRLVR